MTKKPTKKTPPSTPPTSPPVQVFPMTSYPIGKILRTRMEIREEWKPLVGKILDAEALMTLRGILAARLSPRITRTRISESLRTLAGQRGTRELLDETCWRVLGNEPRLLDGMPALPWTRQASAEWVPVQIIRVRLARGGKRGEELGYELHFQVLAGSSCPRLIVQWWSRRRAHYFATRKEEDGGNGWGFSRSRPSRRGTTLSPYPYSDPRQFATLRCYVRIEPELCDEGPNFRSLMFTSNTREWNHEQQKYRARLTKTYECPQGFDRSLACYQCPVGLDRCRAAVHPVTYEYRVCKQCGQERPHDPADRKHKCCVECVEKLVLQEN